jgi:PAS domain S-box-containing protein
MSETPSSIAPLTPPEAIQLASEEAALHLAAIVQNSDDAILSKNLKGTITSWNTAAERLFGYSAAEIVGKPVTTLIPPDRLDEEPSILSRLKAGERIDHYETVRRRKDGSLVDISLTVSPLRNSQGVIIGASKIARDISDRKRAFEQQQLLLGEMQHRTRNLVAVIEGIARQSRPRNEPIIDSYIDELMARLRALFSGSELILASTSRRASVLEVARAALAPFITTGQGPVVTFFGPHISVSEHTAAGLALAFHELGTNALKYGALRNPRGRVVLTVAAETTGDQARVAIDWKETGGEIVNAKSDRRGFGTRVIEAAVSAERDNTTQITFEATGLRCRFAFTASLTDVKL